MNGCWSTSVLPDEPIDLGREKDTRASSYDLQMHVPIAEDRPSPMRRIVLD